MGWQGKPIEAERQDHGDLSGEVDLLHTLLDHARDEIARLRAMTREGALQVQLLHPEAKMPTRAHEGDAGLDLYVIGNHHIYPGEFRDLPCGIAVQFPRGVWGMIVGRSSTWRREGLHVITGIIDEGYRGPLFAGVQNPWKVGPAQEMEEAAEIRDGQRIAQLLLLPTMTHGLQIEMVESLEESSRGEKGFGSTGA